MKQQDVIDFCLSLNGAFKRYPFGGYGSKDGPLVMTVLKTKMFCIIYEGTAPLHILLKCDPLEAEFLRSVYPFVKPGYHCNKKHWNSVYIDDAVPDGETRRMIENSYALVMKKHGREKVRSSVCFSQKDANC